MHDLSNSVKVHSQVVVHEDVPKAGKAAPIHIPVLRFQIVRQAQDRLRHDLKVVQNSALHELVAQELSLSRSGESLNSFRALQGVEHENPWLLQTGTASRSTSSLSR